MANQGIWRLEDRAGGIRAHEPKRDCPFFDRTAMSDPYRYLPPEVLDHIVDLLHANPEALKQCCLASKLLIPRTQKHLFGQIDFRTPADLEAWKKTFPDPANSPACYTHSLIVDCLEVVTPADAEEGGWIRTFTNVVQLKLQSEILRWPGTENALVPSLPQLLTEAQIPSTTFCPHHTITPLRPYLFPAPPRGSDRVPRCR